MDKETFKKAKKIEEEWRIIKYIVDVLNNLISEIGIQNEVLSNNKVKIECKIKVDFPSGQEEKTILVGNSPYYLSGSLVSVAVINYLKNIYETKLAEIKETFENL